MIVKFAADSTGGARQIPHSGAPVVPAGLDGKTTASYKSLTVLGWKCMCMLAAYSSQGVNVKRCDAPYISCVLVQELVSLSLSLLALVQMENWPPCMVVCTV